MGHAITVRSNYMNHVHESPRKIMSRARRVLPLGEFDTLVGTGLSGTLIVPRIAERLGVHWLVIRRENDGSHASGSIIDQPRKYGEGTLGERWVFVDDLIDTGETLSRVKDRVAKIAEYEGHATLYVGAYLYGDGPRDTGDFQRSRHARV